MPKSRVRKKEKAHVAAEVAQESWTPPKESPKWLAPTMVTLFLIGLLWIVVFYLSQEAAPIPDIKVWNMVIGFGFIAGGFSLATRWR